MKTLSCLSIAASAILWLAAGGLHGQDLPVPGELQAPLFKKVFSHDKALQGSTEIIVFLVGSQDDEPSMMEMLRAFQSVGLVPAMVSSGVLEENVSSNTVVYLMPGADKALVAQFCVENGILSISGLPPLAEEGHVSISIDKSEQQPRIIVNLQRLKAEGHTLSADVLKLAKVIR